MNLNLEGKVVVVTGSSRGIGYAIAEEFMREGARVVLTGRDELNLNKAQQQLARRFSTELLLAFAGDLYEEDNIRRCIKTTVDLWGGIDILIANIGVGRGKSFEQMDMNEWNDTLTKNLSAAAFFAKETIPVMPKRTGGAICFISSIAGCEAIHAPIGYSVAKAGINALAKKLSREMADSGIRVNVVIPGNIFFEGGIWNHKEQDEPARVQSYINSEVPLKRFGKPEEVAACVAFLCSSRASFITGASLLVDGGQTKSFQ